MTLLRLSVTAFLCNTVIATYSYIDPGQAQQDVFLQCLNSLFHADSNQDNKLTVAEYPVFLQDFSSQLYPLPIFPKDERDRNSIPVEIKQLFDLLIEAGGGNRYLDVTIDIYGAQVQDLIHIDQQRFDQLHTICRMTENAFSLLARATKSPVTMVLELTMLQGDPGDEDGLVIRIKPMPTPAPTNTSDDKESNGQVDKNSKSQSGATILQDIHQLDKAKDSIRKQFDNVDSIEKDIHHVWQNQTSLILYEASNHSLTGEDLQDNWDFDDRDSFFVWDEAYRQEQYNKNKKDLQDLKEALIQEKKLLAEEMGQAHDVLVKSQRMPSKEVDDQHYNATTTADSTGISHPKKQKCKKQPEALNVMALLLDPEEVSSDVDYEVGDDEQESNHKNVTLRKPALRVKQAETEAGQERSDEPVDSLKVAESKNISPSNPTNGTLEDVANLFDDDDDDELQVDENGEDIQILSIDTSFIIFNFEKITADAIDISNNGTLDRAFEDFVALLIGTVCDKAGIGRTFRNCSDIPEVITGEQAGNSGRQLFTSGRSESQRTLDGAEFDEEHGINFDFTIMNPELYAIEDMECPKIAKFRSKPLPTCQTVFAHYNLLLNGLDGDLRKMEANYLIITAKGIEDGQLKDSLQMVDPSSPHHINDGVGSKSLPVEHLQHYENTEGRKETNPKKKVDAEAHEFHRKQMLVEDPDWEEIGHEESFKTDRVGLLGKVKYNSERSPPMELIRTWDGSNSQASRWPAFVSWTVLAIAAVALGAL